jgi:hypothetical protein
MTHYSNQQSMIFNLISHLDYSKSWDEIEYGLGYDLGDYNFGQNDVECRKMVIDGAKVLWAVFNGRLNTDGDTTGYQRYKV